MTKEQFRLWFDEFFASCQARASVVPGVGPTVAEQVALLYRLADEKFDEVYFQVEGVNKSLTTLGVNGDPSPLRVRNVLRVLRVVLSPQLGESSVPVLLGVLEALASPKVVERADKASLGEELPVPEWSPCESQESSSPPRGRTSILSWLIARLRSTGHLSSTR